MRKNESISVIKYFYHMQARLENAVTDCSYRYIRNDLDSVELLEEIIAKENLKLFNGIMYDILHILKLTEEDWQQIKKEKSYKIVANKCVIAKLRITTTIRNFELWVKKVKYGLTMRKIKGKFWLINFIKMSQESKKLFW